MPPERAIEESLRLYEQDSGIVKHSPNEAVRRYHGMIGKQVAENMTPEQRVARASAGGYARWATKFGISVDDYLKAKIQAEKQGTTVAEYLKSHKK